MIGIDLGTTNSAVAILEKKNVRIIEDEYGRPITPSVVHVDEDILVGEEAVYAGDPLNTITGNLRNYINK